ncbi:MAG: sulfate adenylyltransferase [Veillonella sp.]|uniref:sulfate adenylyltransferase subunit 1 n=1 Tax=Veillonella sp. TaxID=1926307 RepID=UPI0025D1F82B|nr:GTP-binding protein [Veillonella sp.]MBS4913917.1 sulfate adenylyltransferase [Veillonella sp.]
MKGLLKFITCGSVDDGKSTLIGHILYDAKLLYADQAKALELESKVGSRGGAIDYSLLLDGLMAEREQGITIDVAYRYFTTDNRSFIVADTPGHEEYTRNMAVGASFADLAIILVDASQGILVQTRRHARICALMGIESFVFAVNKMDLVGYKEDVFRNIEADIAALAKEVGLKQVQVIPVSATEGDNITVKATTMPWYEGPALLPYLETVDASGAPEDGFYMPVQRVCRPNHTFRGFQGQVEAGSVALGDTLTVLPSGESAKVKSLMVGFSEVTEAHNGQPLTVELDREIDVSRGSVLVKQTGIEIAQIASVKLLWMDDEPLEVGNEYLVSLGTKQVAATVTDIQYQIDVNSGEHLPAATLGKNSIALCTLHFQTPVVMDEFRHHKTLGELILINRVSNMTSACGVVEAVGTVAEQHSFEHNGLTARGDVFDEFYYNVEGLKVDRIRPNRETYTVGDNLPLAGDSYNYPANFDILVVRDKVAIEVRGGKLAAMVPLDEYVYNDVAVVNGRGFAVQVKSADDVKQFIAESFDDTLQHDGAWHDKWLRFETYRKIIFHDSFWAI